MPSNSAREISHEQSVEYPQPTHDTDFLRRESPWVAQFSERYRVPLYEYGAPRHPRGALPRTHALFDADPDRLIVDKTPSYSDSPEILEAIGSQFTNAKYIYLVRNPVDVIRSLVKIQLYKGAIEGCPPGMWLLAESPEYGVMASL